MDPGKIDPPRRRRRRSPLHLLPFVAVGGAVLFAVVVWIASQVNGDNYTTIVYVIAAVIGAGVSSGLLVFLSSALADGDDETILHTRPGPADTPIEGAEAVDEGHVPHTAEGR